MDHAHKFLNVCSQAVVVLGAVVGLLVFVGTPLAQNFIKETVDARINALEVGQEQLQEQIEDFSRQQDQLSRSIGSLGTAQQGTDANTEAILRLLQEMQQANPEQ